MKTYSFLNTIFLVNGVEITGWDEGDDVISMARVNQSANDKVGVDGEMTVSISADRRGDVSIRLMQTSESNLYLSGLVNAQENGAFVPIFMQFKDVETGDLISATQGYIKKPADMQRGENAQSQTWEFRGERLDMLYLA